jgi:hypothetical protein
MLGTCVLDDSGEVGNLCASRSPSGDCSVASSVGR